MENLQTPALLASRGFEFTKRLGKGSQGELYAAKSPDGEMVAVKCFHLGSEWKEHELFAREVAALRGLDHSQVPAFIDFIEPTEADGSGYLVTSLISGETLQQRVEREGPMPLETARSVARGLLEVLRYLHNLTPPLVHRDIKPSNVMLGPEGGVFLVDFGTVRRGQSEGSTVGGTFGYMAPEQLRGQAMPASDLFGLGSTLLFALTGIDPSRWPMRAMRPDLEAPELGIPEGMWREALGEMLEPDVDQRLGDAAKCAEFFDDAALVVASSPPEDAPSWFPAVAPNRSVPAVYRAAYAKKLGLYLPLCIATVALGVVLIPTVGAWLGSVVLMAFLPFIWLMDARADYKRFSALYRHGLMFEGTVQRMAQRSKGMRVHYSYEADGAVYEGSFLSGPVDVELEVGDLLDVLVNPDEPGESMPAAVPPASMLWIFREDD